MRKSNLFCALLSLCLLVLYSSCSNNETEIGNLSERKSAIEQKFNASKLSTIGHNIMLENVYDSLKSNPIAVNKNILEDESALDSCINIFIAANKDVDFDNKDMTRSVNESFPSFSYLKQSILNNNTLRNCYTLTRMSSKEELTYPDYLIMFYDEFFNVEEVNMDSLDAEILTTIEKVVSSYPNLTDEELDGLFFVAGVTYNSCIYWYNNSDKWTAMLAPRQETRSNWVWDGVKNGVKKWAQADSSGALAAWSASKTASVAFGGTALLAGAAAGSVVGAWENLPIWD